MSSAKKRKIDFEAMEKDRERIKRKLSELQAIAENCSLREVADMMMPDQLLSFAAFKLGFNFVCSVVSAINVVPAESGPWRLEITKSLIISLLGKTQLHTQLTEDQEYLIGKLLQTPFDPFSKPLVGGISYHEVFTKIMSREQDGSEKKDQTALKFAGCIAPPIKYCLICQQELTKHNNPTHVTYYLPEGPLPFLKVELRCRTCQYNYGVSKYGNNKEGYKFYNKQSIVEASDVVYLDRLLMTMFTNLR